MSEDAKTTRDGVTVPEEQDGCNLHAHFQYFVLSRLRTLMQDTLDMIRLEESPPGPPAPGLEAYAAAFILHFEVAHFSRNLRNGHLYRASQASFFCFSYEKFLVRDLHFLDAACLEGSGRYHC